MEYPFSTQNNSTQFNFSSNKKSNTHLNIQNYSICLVQYFIQSKCQI